MFRKRGYHAFANASTRHQVIPAVRRYRAESNKIKTALFMFNLTFNKNRSPYSSDAYDFNVLALAGVTVRITAYAF